MSRAQQPIVGRHYDGSPLRIGNEINVANASEKRWSRNRFLLIFGQMGSTYLLVYSDSLEDAIEVAGDWLLEEKLFGHITPHSAPKEDLCCDCENPFDCESHLYTEAGWISNDEWFVNENPSNDQLRKIHHQ